MIRKTRKILWKKIWKKKLDLSTLQWFLFLFPFIHIIFTQLKRLNRQLHGTFYSIHLFSTGDHLKRVCVMQSIHNQSSISRSEWHVEILGHCVKCNYVHKGWADKTELSSFLFLTHIVIFCLALTEIFSGTINLYQRACVCVCLWSFFSHLILNTRENTCTNTQVGTVDLFVGVIILTYTIS